MGYFLEGLILGLGLAISLGPIFITLTQVSIDRGIKGGLTVGAGIWISDIIFITFFYNFINIIRDTIESPAFLFWMGLSGAIVFMLVKQPVLNYSQEKLTVKNYIGLFTKGFMVNSINPFTFVYWMGVTSTYMIGQQISESSMITLLLTILTVIILSDSIKVLLAHFLRSRLTVASANVIFNISGAILICFGLYMFVQVI
jgi:threonine/homoserine/homoserine lactone efflux protein